MFIVINSMDTYNVKYARAANDFDIKFYNQSEFLNTVQDMNHSTLEPAGMWIIQ